ncbi:hypothetical protein PC9H_000071 [Pleurotus ostreatus]|uniref:Uncharacterized protein n=1 Tax=Pleurotus ostreatus TaxID=5322 RepID=A0A8H7A0E3_PLEOS|nr:uncharacterized protein PC9H_000071 [Pleurotus ostreatus]KAF7439735.1 hypothetical protein PC9H_000071 [Pleurotus ostreatus]KAJ8701111.1 hypothetical protein PTI98_004069 [Pleurotus ostreatus]
MFFKAHDFTIKDSTFNDIAGDQHITTVTNTYHHSQIVAIPSSQTATPALTSITPIQDAIPLPTSEPFSSFISLVIEIQRALSPIGLLVDEMGLFRPLEDDLLVLIKSAAFLGRTLEILKSTGIASLFGAKTMANRLAMYTIPLQKAVGEIRRYQDGLKFTLIGPIWRRILWSAVWTMSSDADISKIVTTIRADLAHIRHPTTTYLRKLNLNLWWSVVERLPDHVVSELDSLRTTASKELPAINEAEIQTISIDFGPQCDTIELSLSPYATYQSLAMVLKYNCDHIVGDIAGFLDPSNDQVVELSQFEELVTSRSRHWHNGPAIVPIWSDNCGVYFEDQTDLCPYCGSPGEKNGLWIQCTWCKRQHRAVSQGASDDGTSGSRVLLPERARNLYNRNPMGYSHINYSGIKWSQLMSSTSISGLQGSDEHLLCILHYLSLGGSPLQELSLISDRSRNPNIILPRSASQSFELASDQPVSLPNLRRLELRPIATGSARILNQISIPQLRYLKLHWPVYSANVPEIFSQIPLLSTLEIQTRVLLDNSRITQLLVDAITCLPNLEDINVHFMTSGGDFNAYEHKLHELAEQVRSRRGKLREINLWYNWATPTAQLPEAGPWTFCTTDCGYVARLCADDL